MRGKENTGETANDDERPIPDLPRIPERMARLMSDGSLYYCGEEFMMHYQQEAMALVWEFNHTPPQRMARRQAIQSKLFRHAGKGLYIEPPLHANWGINTSWGDGCYANFNLTLVDNGPIDIGDHVLLGPNVTLCTTGHPVDPVTRSRGAQYSQRITIEDGVWIGAGAIVLPGVTIGRNAVIGAGSVVTKDVPADVVAFGNPCRVHRPVGERDRRYYWKDRPMPDPKDIPQL